MQHWIDTLEKYYEDIPTHLKQEVREFLDEYHEKKDTHSATSLDGLSDEELGELLYLDIDFEEIPDKIKFCTNLKILHLGHISTDNINQQLINQLKDLRILNLKEVYSNEINILDFTVLKKLIILAYEQDHYNIEVENYQWKTLPMLNESKILFLSIHGQKISSIPYLKNLLYLDYSNNNLYDLPSSIKSLTQLRFLNISQNFLTNVDETLVRLKDLETLHITFNKFEKIPYSIFSLKKLKEIRFLNNPFNEELHLRDLSSSEEFILKNETPLFKILKQNYTIRPDDYNYFTLKIPKALQTPMLQYISFFKDYVEATKGQEIIFEVRRAEEGLTLVTNGNVGVTLEQLSEYFQEYVNLIGKDLDKWIPEFEVFRTRTDADLFRLQVENQVGRFKSELEIARFRNKNLSKQLSDAEGQIEFLQNLSQSLAEDIKFLVHGKTAKTLNVDQLLLDIQDVIIRMQERKYSHRLEDLHNDTLTTFLREKGYIADQSRSGRSATGLGVGELDIMIRKVNGTPFSIIEAFRLSSCGEDNRIVAQHISKLLNDYDTSGHERNFIVVYAEASNFERLWENYKKYVSEINGKQDFNRNYVLVKFEEDTKVSEKSSIKIGKAEHWREGKNIEIYHIFANMFA